MDAFELKKLLTAKEPEGLKLDFKQKIHSIDHPEQKVRNMHWDELIKDILALCNGNIGTTRQMAYLIFGVSDRLNEYGYREIFDIGEVNLTAQRILQKINSACIPPLPDLSLKFIQYESKRILIIEIPPSPHLHETIRVLKTPKKTFSEHTVFIRHKENIGVASFSEREAILHEKQTFPDRYLDNPNKNDFYPTELIKEHRRRLGKIFRYARWAENSREESYIFSKGVHLPLYVSPYSDIGGEREELWHYIKSNRKLLILGEPGMGKTVALEHAMWALATSTNITVPVFVPLIQYDGSLKDQIINGLNESEVLNISNYDHLEQFIRRHQCIFLLDGLNEVASAYREIVYKEISAFIISHPSSSFIMTSRSQDELWTRFHSREMIEDAVVVRRITEKQILDYLISHLGGKRGKELFDRLNKALKGLARIPLLLWLIKEAGLSGEELPGNRGELFDRFVRQVLIREQKQPFIASVPIQSKMEMLSKFAFHLQERKRLTGSREEALKVTHDSQGNVDAQIVIEEALRNGLLMGDSKLHFMHQAVHEYFAALRLKYLMPSQQMPDKKVDRFIQYTSKLTISRRIGLWAKDNWWAEVIVQLAGIVDDPSFLAKKVLRTNPWLAYWCAIEGQELPNRLFARIESQTVERLKSANKEEKLRVIRELARMENPRTAKHLAAALHDENKAIWSLAKLTLIQLGEPSVDPLLEILESDNEISRLISINTLAHIWQFSELRQLGSQNVSKRSSAAKILGNMGDTRAVLPLIASLKDSSEEVRINTANSLGKLGDVRAVEPLLVALEKSYQSYKSDESAALAGALEKLGKPTEDPLLVGLKNPKHSIRNSALKALSNLRSIPEIRDLASNSTEKRLEAVRRLSLIDRKLSGEPLSAALWDEEQLVRWEACKAIGRIWKIPEIEALGNKNVKDRRTAAFKLSSVNSLWIEKTIEPLICALRDKDFRVQENAALSLAVNCERISSEASLERLLSLFYHDDRAVRKHITRVIAKIPNERVLSHLTFAIQDDRLWVRETAAQTLVKMGNKGIPILQVAISNNNPEIKKLAIFSLRRIGSIQAQGILRGIRESELRN
ncbi:MAG: HEAT repeat domain-containing protein [Anaerolineaceae bacterium]|nr:HEAT repeat domain-containing protein [Anaerolineaceae bacterium]